MGCGEDTGLHSKHDGKPLVFLSKGRKGSNLCFQKIPVAFMWQRLERLKGWSKETSEEGFVIFIPNRNECLWPLNHMPETICSSFVLKSSKLEATHPQKMDKQIVWCVACSRGSLLFHCANSTTWFAHTVEYYTAVKNIQLHTTTWKDLKTSCGARETKSKRTYIMDSTYIKLKNR